jgi:DNA topoisomerase-3
LEEIRSGSSVKDFKSEITEYTKMITNELLIAGASISGKLEEEKKMEKV